MRLLCTLLILICTKAVSATHGAYFEANRGQADPSVAFVARGTAYTVLLESHGNAIYCSPVPLNIEFMGGHTPSKIEGEQPLGSVTNYYGGANSDVWQPGVPHFERVRFRGIYPGIDLMWRSQGADLEYEFHADAGADLSRIRMRFTGATHVSVDAQGNLILETPAGRIAHRRPVAWQELHGRRQDVQVALRLTGRTAGLALGPYDHQHPLWIDPVVSYSTYVAGSGYDAGYAIAVDASGGVYITGTSSSYGFPAPGSGVKNHYDAFVMKFNESGTLLYTTILASNANSSGQSIAVDAAGNAYIAGTTEASNFPVTRGAWQTVSTGTQAAFAAKLDPSGNLVYATYIGGAGQTTGTGVAIDSSGNAYISGYTSSAFPTTSGAAQVLYAGGFADAFVVKLNAQGSAALYSTLLGGTGNDEAQAIAVNAAGQACIAGYTDSASLATYSALQPSPGGEGDVLIACLNAGGSAWTTISYLGGSNLDQAYAMDMDAGGNLYVAGTTFSPDFPVTAGVVQPANAGAYDAFVAKLSPGAASLIYATFLGGSGNDTAAAIAVGSAGDVWIGGYTASMNFPLSGPWQFVPGGRYDGFVSHLSANAGVLVSSSYLGGAEDDRVLGIGLDSTGLAFVTGSTLSPNFPVTPGAMQTAAPTGMNAFLASISPSGYAISGQVSALGSGPVGGMTVTLSGAPLASVQTDVDGNFLFNNLSGGATYTVTPSLANYTFTPSSQTFTNLNANQTANFTASTTHSITGHVTLSGGGPLSGVAVALSGASSGSAVTDASGYYAFNALALGTYTVTPSLSGYSFNPSSQQFNSLNANQTADFTASVVTPPPPQTDLIWQDPVSGFSQMWFMGGPQGTTLTGAATITIKNIWRIAAMADFNGDGYPDIVWQDPVSGTSQIWFMGGPQGITLLSAVALSGPNPWHIVAAGDFNRDGHPDLVWQDPVSGWAQIWFMGGPQGITLLNAVNLTLRNPWHIVGCGDFNGDGQPDMLWQDPVSGTVQVWYLTGALGNALLSAVNLATSTSHVVSVADFNHDGHPDVVWQDPVSGASSIWLLGGAQGITQLGTATLSGPNPWRIVAPR